MCAVLAVARKGPPSIKVNRTEGSSSDGAILHSSSAKNILRLEHNRHWRILHSCCQSRSGRQHCEVVILVDAAFYGHRVKPLQISLLFDS